MEAAQSWQNDRVRAMTTVYTNTGGGLGDCLFVYFTRQQFCYLEPLKAAMPEVSVIHVNTAHMDWCYELVYMHPCIDGWLNYKWYPPGHELERLWKNMISALPIEDFCKQHKINPGSPPKLYLSDLEEQMVDNIVNQGPYITIQAFGGLPFKGCKPDPSVGRYLSFPDYKYLEVMSILKEQYGYNIVLLGRSTFADYGTRRQDCTLELPKTAGYFDFTDKCSIRVSTALVMKSAGFVGVASSLMTAARVAHRPQILFLPIIPAIVNLNPVKANGGPACKFSMEEPWCTLYELPPDDYLERLSAHDVVNQLLENINMQSKAVCHG